jgi:putative radical SAM enzyme (TIGR03279 family)
MNGGVALTGIEAGGLAGRIGLRAGDVLLAINGHPVEDQLDVRFYSSARRLKICWRRGETIHEASARVRPGEDLGWEAESFAPRRCTNRCPFCFVLQLPRGLRRPLYFRDEDYRLSFLYGHYITGTSLSERDLERIARLRLSPLYISVHATEPGLRARMLGRRDLPPLTPLLDFFASHDIAFHAQIVVCPDWNDGPALRQTLDDLCRFHPALRSVALVPVGLTAHRAHLPHIRPITPGYAARFIDAMAPLMRQWRRALGERVLFVADEWYLRAGRTVPDYRGIDIAPQFENGVGMVGQFLRPWRAVERRLPRTIEPRRSVAIVTGVSAAVFLRPIVARLNRIKGLHASLIVVRNRLFGPTVTVSGLLAGRDILEALLSHRRADAYLLPANCLRPWDRVFLDDLSLDHLSKHLDRPVFPIEGTCRDLVNAVLASANNTRPPKAA